MADKKEYDRSWLEEPMVDIGEYESVQLSTYKDKWYIAERYRKGDGVYKKWTVPASYTKEGKLFVKPISNAKTVQIPIGGNLAEARKTLQFFVDEIDKKIAAGV